MPYTPIKLITQNGLYLTESTDLSVITNTLLREKSFLVLEHNSAIFVLDLNKAITFTPDLNLQLPVSQVFSTHLNDAFVTAYRENTIPVKSANLTYPKGLKVFNPIAYKNYKVQFTSMDTPEYVDDSTRKGFLDDLVITGPDDLSSCLVSVNGVFHKTSILNNKLYVHDGFRTMRLTAKRDVCVVDTGKLGGHAIVPLTSANVQLTAYNQYATITSPTSLKNKTVLLVIDGYMYHLDTGVFSYINDTHIRVETTKLPLVDQLRHNPRTVYYKDRFGNGTTQGSRKYTDAFSELFLNNRSVSTSTFETRDFQYSRLTHYHSFMIVFDSPGIYPISTELMSSGVSRFYTESSTVMRNGILDYGVGLVPSYLIWKDPYKRKIIFINEQDNDTDRQLDVYDPAFIPTLFSEETTDIPQKVRLIDYVKF